MCGSNCFWDPPISQFLGSGKNMNLLNKISLFLGNVLSSVQFSCSVVSDSLRHHGLQQARLPCPSPTPIACSNSRPLNWCCHPTISSSVVPFSSHLQSFPASGSFPISQFFESGGQRIGVSASTSVLPMNIQDWFPLGLTGWISLLSKGLSKVFSNTTVQKHQFLSTQLSLSSNPHNHIWLLKKTLTLTRWTFVGKVMSLPFNVLSRLVITFLPRSKHLLVSWLQSPSAVILEPKKITYVTVSIVSPSICREVMGQNAMILVFWMLSFKLAFSLSSFTFKRPFSSLVSAIRVVSSAYLRLLIFLLQSWFQLVLHPAWHFTCCTLHIS